MSQPAPPPRRRPRTGRPGASQPRLTRNTGHRPPEAHHSRPDTAAGDDGSQPRRHPPDAQRDQPPPPPGRRSARDCRSATGRSSGGASQGTPELHQSRPFVNKHDKPAWQARLLRHPASALAGELMLSFMAPQAGIGDDRGMFAMTA